MTQWWYADKNKKIGPVEMDELRRLLQNGKISLSTIVWQEGMTTWQPLGEVEPLRALNIKLIRSGGQMDCLVEGNAEK